MAEDRAAGLIPLAVVVSAGTTNTGAVDPLDEMADLCAEEKTWLHADAAYGGFAVLSKQTRGALLVVAAGRTKRPELTRSLATLENVGARVGGIILTMVPAKGPDAYTYGREAYTRSDDAAASAANRASGMSSVGMDRLP